MLNLNAVSLFGRLTRQPEVRFTTNGTAVASFGVAANRQFKQGEDLKEEVCFVDIVVFGKQAEACGQHLEKGQAVIVTGRLQQRRWEDGNGDKHSKHEVVADHVSFGPKKQNQEGYAYEEEGA